MRRKVGFDATDTSFEIVKRKEKENGKWEERHKRLERIKRVMRRIS